MSPERDLQPFYTKFKDRALSTAQKRGAETAAWDDVLSVATDTHETRDVLIDQGISPTGLKRDIAYSLHYGRPDVGRRSWQPMVYADSYSQAVGALMNDINDFKSSQTFLKDSDNQKASGLFMDFLNGYLNDKERIINDPDGIQVAQIKAKLLQESLEGFMKQLKPSFPKLLSSLVPKDNQELMAQVNQLFTTQVLNDFLDFTMSKSRVIVTPDKPLLLFDAMDKSDGRIAGALTPFQVVDASKKAADPFIEYVLYRNGLVAPEAYEPPCSMPSPTIITHALLALDFVEKNRQKEVGVPHLLPGLLQEPEVVRLLMDLDKEHNISEKEEESPLGFLLGQRREYSRNFIKFYNFIHTNLAPQQEGLDIFRFRPQISEELREFLNQTESAVKNGPKALAAARLFGKVIAQKDVRTILFKAGLSANQLKRWPKVYKDAQDKKIKEEETVKNQLETPFKIDDKQLEDALEEWGSERTKLALTGKVDPVIGREAEIDSMVRILLQRNKPNPLLLGEPGVGKTVLFDGLAQRIASGNVPRSLIGARVIAIDLSAMNSGTMFRGQFEGRLLPIVKGVSERNAKKDKPPIILCIDEIHSALQAGTASGTPGAGELLKPPLSRGELPVIGATTQADYAKHIQIDGALDRRFETIFIYPPGYEQTITILKGLRENYSKFHQINLPEELIPVLVRLTDRYLPNLNQPDKAITVLDASYAHAKTKNLTQVDQSTIINTIATTAKLDPRFLQENEGARFLRLKEELPREVLGQEEAVNRIAEALIVAKADLHDPKKPLGQFLLMGPTGVGKTETARALARLLFGTDEALIRIDMSNMREAHEDSRLFGTTPGFIGYGQEGELTGAVRKKPYAVVLLDEIEKAHKDVFKRLLPIFEEGEVRDGRNQVTSFRNTIILMSSNLGSEEAGKEYRRRDTMLRQNETWRKLAIPEFEKAAKAHFVPEFLNRLDGQIIYQPLSKDVIHDLVGREIGTLARRVQQRWGLAIDVPNTVYDQLAQDGYNDEYGARYLKRTVTTELITPLATWLLENESTLQSGSTIKISGLGKSLSAVLRGK